MKDGLQYINELQKDGVLVPVDKILITNATLLNDDIAFSLKEHNVSISVSIDGPKELHDKNRVVNEKEGSFEKVMNGFKALKGAGIAPTVSCVIGKTSVFREKEILRFIIEELGVKAIGFNHVSIVPDLTNYDPEYENSFAQSVVNAQDIIQDHYPDVYERRMSRKINNFIDKIFVKADCTGCGEQVSISVDGDVGICQGYMGNRKTFNNTIFDEEFDPNNDELFIEWSNRSPINMEECLDCIALATCGGGCPRNADLLSGSIWNLDKAFCHFARKAQEYMIWRKYDAICS